jgi:hypothetical protein
MRVPFLCSLLVLSTATLVLGQDTDFANGPQYLMTGSPLFVRSIATPTLSLESPPLEAGASNSTSGMIAGAATQTVAPQTSALPNLFSIYYGPSATSVIEISFAALSAELPASLLDTGMGQTTTGRDLQDLSYRGTLGGAVGNQKAHAGRATHVYTNADLAQPQREKPSSPYKNTAQR